MNSKIARTLRLGAEDNVLIAVERIEPGETVAEGIVARARIPFGHKMASRPIGSGEPVRKFGQIIGFASQPIEPGDWVHEHNVGLHDFERDYQFCADARPENVLPVEEQATFQGFRRANGRAGTRNYLGILTSVNCSASVARFMAEAATRSGLLDDFPNVDGVVSFTHGTGCGMAGSGEGFDILQRTQWGYAGNPNLGAVLLVGLGCEVFQIGR
ncbi:UxaA family hydrolase, partial [Sphingomonas sp.]|uniref:UxaA family hydrolase n=1 Tax=Sphingomonas sp. TaxID=28214 RepID=UPI002FC79F70